MKPLVIAATLLAAVALGLTSGALLAEGAIFVPFWRSLPPESFLAWYKQHAALLQEFFGPLEIAAAILTIAATILSWVTHHESRRLLALSTLLAVAVLAVFPLYFQSANAGFASGTIPSGQVAAELRRWSDWHWARTIIATAAFISAVAALRSTAPPPAS